MRGAWALIIAMWSTPAGADYQKLDIDLGDVVDLDVGDQVACAATRAGPISCWGFVDQPKQHKPGEPTPFSGSTGSQQVAVYGRKICGRLPMGKMLCWMADGFGRLAGDYYGDPNPDISEFGTGEFPCVITTSGQVQCREATSPRMQPMATSGIAVSASAGGGCACLSHGELSCWGTAVPASAGPPGSVPQRVSQVTGALSVAVNRSYACALRHNGTALCWGQGFWASDPAAGPVGPATSTDLVVLKTPAPVRQLDGEPGQLCFVTQENALTCWSADPQHRISASNVRKVAVGSHTCALGTDGRVTCWGEVTHVEEPQKVVKRAKPTRSEYPGSIGSFSLRTHLGGGVQKAPGREKLLDVGIRADALFGWPSAKNAGWGIGPLIELRSADFEAWEAGGGGSLEGHIGPASLSLSGGAAYLCSHGEVLRLGFATAALGIRMPVAEVYKECDGCLLYAPHMALYATARRGLGGYDYDEVVFGVESPVMTLAFLYWAAFVD